MGTDILLIEDDPVLGESLKTIMVNEELQVNWQQTAKSAREAMNQKKPDLAIFDLDLPDGNGIDLVKEAREQGHRYPIIILTAFSGEHFVIQGLEAGANDYLRKPLGNQELVARIKVHLRGANIASSPQKNEIKLDHQQRSLCFRDDTCYFNTKQMALLKELYQQEGRIVKRAQLISSLDSAFDIDERTIDSHLSQIRKKLRDAGIKGIKIGSVYGVGYRLEKK
ncbi:MAG: hypothetical protein CMP10_20070 [Zetaproteobacteria bacterium]|nr:hypothetical protein [Pseudobdellovibrionaceae bacterium]